MMMISFVLVSGKSQQKSASVNVGRLEKAARTFGSYLLRWAARPWWTSESGPIIDVMTAGSSAVYGLWSTSGVLP